MRLTAHDLNDTLAKTGLSWPVLLWPHDVKVHSLSWAPQHISSASTSSSAAPPSASPRKTFRAGIHASYVSQRERSLKSPSLRILLPLAQALDTTAAALVQTVEKGISQAH